MNRFRAIGDLEATIIPKRIKEKVIQLEEMTKDKTGICFNMAFNYGGRDEIVRACKKIAEQVKQNKLDIADINEVCFEDYLDTKGMPEPDLLIRTSGEMRTSNFLPWQLSYTEFYFASCLWPDFNTKELDKAIDAFNERQRRFGKSE